MVLLSQKSASHSAPSGWIEFRVHGEPASARLKAPHAGEPCAKAAMAQDPAAQRAYNCPVRLLDKQLVPRPKGHHWKER